MCFCLIKLASGVSVKCWLIWTTLKLSVFNVTALGVPAKVFGIFLATKSLRTVP